MTYVHMQWYKDHSGNMTDSQGRSLKKIFFYLAWIGSVTMWKIFHTLGLIYIFFLNQITKQNSFLWVLYPSSTKGPIISSLDKHIVFMVMHLFAIIIPCSIHPLNYC